MHKKANLDNIGFNFYDLLEYIKVYNPTKPKLYNDANSFLILNIIDFPSIILCHFSEASSFSIQFLP